MTRELKSMDGNNAAAHVSYAFTEVAGIYPITPSSPMADFVDIWAAQGRKNIFGTTVKVVRDAVRGRCGRRGSRLSGHRRADHHLHGQSQGLLLMIPNMYKIAGELLPDRLPRVGPHRRHPGAEHLRRPLRRHGLPPDRFRHAGRGQRAGGHGPVRRGPPGRHQGPRSLPELLRRLPHLPRDPEDRRCGTTRIWPRWCDMDAVRRLPRARPEPGAPGHARLPRERRHLLPAPRGLQPHLRRPARPSWRSTWTKVNAKLGTNYQLFNYYGAPDADRVIVAMGSICDVAEEVIDYLNAHGEKVGLVKVRLYRPFRRREVRGRPARDREEDRRARPHQGARLHGRAAVPGRRDRAVRRGPRPASPSSAAATASAPRTPRPASVFAVYDELEQGRAAAASSPSASWTT